MLPCLKITLIKEDDCLCQFIHKGKYYTAVPKRYKLSPITSNGSYAILEGKREKVTEKDLSEFKDGKYERFYIDCEIWPRQEYMTCMELYTSQDFEEAVETAFLYRGNPTHLMTHIQDVDGNKLVSGGYYRSIPYILVRQMGQLEPPHAEIYDEFINTKAWGLEKPAAFLFCVI